MTEALPPLRWNIEGVGIDQDALGAFDAGPLDLPGWFGDRRDLPLELEIGSGKGTFLVQQAPKCLDVNFIGIEYTRAIWGYAADRARRHGLTNVRLVHTEAAYFLRNFAPDDCFAQVHIYFPDPWPKKRQNKRRFVQESNLRLLHGKMKPGANLRIATDHSDYFQWMEDHAQQVDDLFERLPFESPESAGEGELVGTNFERKYRREGRPFNAMVLKKR